MASSFVELAGYRFYRCDVEGTVRKHGVGLYLADGLDAASVDINVPNVLVVHLLAWDLYVIVVYRPPSYDEQENYVLKQFIVDFCFGKNVLILGDFNLPSLRWNEEGELAEGYIRPLDLEFYEAFLEVGLTQSVSMPTFALSGSILDLIFVSNAEMVGSIEVLPPFPRCHHSPVLVDLCLEDTLDPPAEKYIRLWNKGNYVAVCNELESMDWDSLFVDQDIDDCFSQFVEISHELINRHVPEVVMEVKPHKWTRPPRALAGRRSAAWKHFLATRGRVGRHHELCLLAWQEFSNLNLEFRNHSLNRQWEHELKLVRSLSHSPKLFHGYLRRKKKGNPPVGPLKYEGNVVSNPRQMGDVFVEYFGSVFNSVIPTYVSDHQCCNSVMSPKWIEISDVMKAIVRLNASSSPGSDEIHPKFLRECAEFLAYPLLMIFVKSLRSGRLPLLWKYSLVTPIFKSGSRSSASNYRPVSLTSVPCKLMEHILVEHITNYLEENGLLSDMQFGFRRGRSTEDQMLLIYNRVSQLVDAGKIVDVAYLDYSKAFDLVSHQLLIDKLSLLGFDRHILGWIHDFLSGRSMSVLVCGERSSQRPVTSGVPQGSVLGPLLFLVYVNYIAKDVTGYWCAFADDFKIGAWYSHEPAERLVGVSSLQADLDALARASSSWNLRLNPAKCVVMRFGARGVTDGDSVSYGYSIDGVPLRFVSAYRDLGVKVDTRLRFHSHIDGVVGKTGAMLNNLLHSTVCRDAEFMVTLWVSHVRPIIEFNSCVWNVGYLHDLRRLESLQRRWTKEIVGMRELDYEARLKHIGMYSIKGRLLRIDLVKVWKAFNAEVDVGVCQVFERSRYERTRGHRFKLVVPTCRSELRRRMFAVRCVSKWNSLPARVAEASTIDSFKKGVDLFLGDSLFVPG